MINQNRNQFGQYFKGMIPWNKGKTFSSETIEKMRKSALERKVDGMEGKEHSRETRHKISVANIGKNLGHKYWGPKDMIDHMKTISKISGEKRRKTYLPKECLVCGNLFKICSKDTTVVTCSRKCGGKLAAKTSNIGNLNRGKSPAIGSGRCKWYRYHSEICGDIKVQGTWELRYVRCLDKIGLNWRPNHNKDRFEYINLKGKISTYNPDFWVNGKYVDVKGYVDIFTKHKLSAIKKIGIPLEIIDWEKLKELETKLFGKPVGGVNTPQSFLTNYQITK